MTNNIARFEKDLSYNDFIVIGRGTEDVTVRVYTTEGKVNYYKCPVKVCNFDGRKTEGIRINNFNYFADIDRNTDSKMKGNDAFDNLIEERMKKGESIPMGFDLRNVHKAIKHAYHAEKVLRAIH